MKNLLGASLLFASLVSVTPVLADTTSTTGTPAKTLDVACVQNTIGKRDDTIAAAFDAFGAAVKSALQTRRDALKAAVALPKDQRSQARTAAWQAFRTSVHTAKTNLRDAQKSAWATFRTELKACPGGKTSGEKTTDGPEMNI
jgi:hypothetical protein